MPDEHTSCRCRGDCATRRCPCHKAGQACGDDCACTGCANPFSEVAGVELGDCARDNIGQVVALTAERMKAAVELPCGCGDAPLEQLLSGYLCPGCNELYWYSFCWNRAVQDGTTWHCTACRVCRDWREWHCERCNRCTYGQSLPCENCGARSSLAQMMGSDW